MTTSTEEFPGIEQDTIPERKPDEIRQNKDQKPLEPSQEVVIEKKYTPSEAIKELAKIFPEYRKGDYIDLDRLLRSISVDTRSRFHEATGTQLQSLQNLAYIEPIYPDFKTAKASDVSEIIDYFRAEKIIYLIDWKKSNSPPLEIIRDLEKEIENLTRIDNSIIDNENSSLVFKTTEENPHPIKNFETTLNETKLLILDWESGRTWTVKSGGNERTKEHVYTLDSTTFTNNTGINPNTIEGVMQLVEKGVIVDIRNINKVLSNKEEQKKFREKISAIHRANYLIDPHKQKETDQFYREINKSVMWRQSPLGKILNKVLNLIYGY